MRAKIDIERTAEEQWLIERKKGAFGPRLDELETSLNRKLYTEFTEGIGALFEVYPDQVESFVDILLFIIHPIVSRVSIKDVVALVERVAEKLPGADGLVFLDHFNRAVSAAGDVEATILYNTARARAHMRIGDSGTCGLILKEDTQILIDKTLGINVPVMSRFYEVLSEYHKSQSAFFEYFKTLTLYLKYTKLGSLAPEATETIAFDLCVSALVAQELYDIVELLEQPVLHVLKDTPRAWVLELVEAAYRGDWMAYETCTSKYQTLIMETPIGVNQKNVVQKMRIMTLMELAFRNTKSERILSFAAIAQAAHIPEADVENLVIKCISKGLICGSIDGVSRTVLIRKVKPRLLDIEKLKIVKSRIADWSAFVLDLAKRVEDQAPTYDIQEVVR